MALSQILSRKLFKFYNKQSTSQFHHLIQKDRGLLRVKGNDVTVFLQGLITNDMMHLTEGAPSMYTMVLNSQGRVMHDVIMYQPKKEEYLLETNVKSVDSLIRHLKMYKLRKKIDIDDVSADYNCSVLFKDHKDLDFSDNKNFDCSYITSKTTAESDLNVDETVQGAIFAKDPRVQLLGYKIILPKSVNINNTVKDLTPVDESSYTELRYKLGVAEAPFEIPSSGITPLEANADYLHGVSFHKGCYIGQELTARIHHTGVVRKRYMPIRFSTTLQSTLPFDSHITNSKGKVVGRIRAHAGQFGIGLMRIENCLADPEGLSVAGNKISTFKPLWWPMEVTKIDK